MTPADRDADRLLRRLAGRRARARLAILFERVWPAIWPALGVAGVFLCAALLGLPQLLSPGPHLVVLAVFALAVVFLLARGLRGIAAPDEATADRRLERVSGLKHRPLSVLNDRPAHTDQAGLALWQAHVARAFRQVRRLRVGLPHPGLARYDRYALRSALVVSLIAAAVIAGEDAPTRLLQALQPSMPGEPAPPATELQAWITPPAYTRMAPLFLKPEGGAVSVPAGSHLTASVTGDPAPPSLSLGSQTSPFRALDASSFQADRDLTTGGHLSVRRGGRELAGWDLTVVADEPPTAAWAEPPGQAASSQSLRLPWRTTDDYGVVGLQAELRLRDRPDAPPLVVSIPVPGGSAKDAHGVNQQDLTAHPWAGLPVVARLMARDALGQTGRSDPAEFVLPERLFQNPLARALIAIRRGLTLHPEDRNAAVGQLDTLLMSPEAFGADYGAYVNLGALYYALEFDRSPQSIDRVQDGLWQLALHLEEGQTERTARALDEARQAARDALDKATKDPTDANRAELERRLQELQAAIDRHMQALLDEMRRSNDEMPFNPNAQQLSNRDLDKLADQARQAARQGKMDDARQRMAELERLLDQLRNARAEHGQNNQRNAEQRQRGRQQMGAVQDMIGRQGGLLDRSQGRTAPTDRSRGAPPDTNPADPNAQRQADQAVQRALRRALGELMQQFGDLTGQVPPSLGDADTAMRSAGQALGQGNDQAASEAEQKAIEALQKGGHEMGQAMAKQFGPARNGEDSGTPDGDPDGTMGLGMQDEQGDAPGRGSVPGQADRRPGGRDPLGRRLGQGSTGADESADVVVPEQRERQRTQAIEEELRRRGGERDRPQQELDYIDRLLKQF